ncbi:MAG: O-methyltransferase [Halobacteriaceae archaeon]
MLTSDAARVIDHADVTAEPLLDEMTAHGRERNFPIVGPNAGRLLRILARTGGAERVFEFGSGFGYSAAWFAGALPDDGEIVLTDYDEDNLASAQGFLRQGGYDGIARYEVGDAIETFRAAEGEFDVVLVDLEKTKYVEAFELAREQVSDGGLVVADNMLDGPMSAGEIADALDGADPGNEHASGIAAYIERVRDDPDFDTSLVPLGEGLAVSCKR